MIEQYFDYSNSEEVKKIYMKLYNYGFKLINETKYSVLHGTTIDLDKTSISDFKFKDDQDKIILGIGFEFLLKSLFLKEGYIIHETSVPKIVKFGDVSSSISINWNRAISFEDMKNKIDLFNFPDNSLVKETLGIIQEWRNGLIHQAKGPDRTTGQQDFDIRKTFIYINNLIVLGNTKNDNSKVQTN